MINFYSNKFESLTRVILASSKNELNLTFGKNVRIEKLSAKNFYDLKNIVRLKYILKRQQADLIISAIYRAQIWSALVKPHCSRLVWMEQNVYNSRSHFQWQLMKFLYFRTSKIIAVCNETSDLIQNKLGKSSVVIANPITFPVKNSLYK